MWKQNKYFSSDKNIYQLFRTKWLLFSYPHECIDSMMIFWQCDVSSKVWLEGMFWSVDLKIWSLIKVHDTYSRMKMEYVRKISIFVRILLTNFYNQMDLNCWYSDSNLNQMMYPNISNYRIWTTCSMECGWKGHRHGILLSGSNLLLYWQ